MSCLTPILSSPQIESLAKTPENTSEPRKHTSKACEHCRRRRTKCIGGIPCEACLKVSSGDSCHVRTKARPRRPISTRHYDGESREVEVPLDDPNSARLLAAPHPLSSHEYGSVLPSDIEVGVSSHLNSVSVDQENVPSFNPSPSDSLSLIENALSAWCFQNKIMVFDFRFSDQCRLATLQADPLPAQHIRGGFEDGLITHLITTVDFEQHSRELKTIDRPRLLSLYGRYKAVPKSLTDDQTALIYASLCLARHTQIAASCNGKGTSVRGEHPSREDVTYYRLACESLRVWGRSSIYSVWALFCLVPYSTAQGGPSETGDLLQQMGSQVENLGLHQLSAAQWYPPEDMVQVMFSAYLYMDLLRASITNMKTFVPLSDIEVDATPPITFVPENLRQASRDAMSFLRDYADPNINTISDQYVHDCETKWEGVLGVIRQDRPLGTSKAKAGWAMIRYYWMRVLLHHPRSAIGIATSTIVVARSITQIIYTYSHLASQGYLNPSWPQLKRISISGQLLILLTASGEISNLEGNQLLSMLMILLDEHAAMWPVVIQMKQWYEQAAHVLELSWPAESIDLGDSGIISRDRSMANNTEDMAWQNLSLMFDPANFLSMTHDEFET